MSRPTTTAASPMKRWAVAPKRSPISARHNRSTRTTRSARNCSAYSVSDHVPRSRLKRECLSRPSQIAFARFRRKAAGIAFPDDSRVLQHVDAVGVRKSEGHVLLAEQHRDRGGLAQLFQ